MSNEHTKTPWDMKRSTVPHDGEYDFAINASGVGARVLAETFGRGADGFVLPAAENAAFIVQAVNAHDDLVAALTKCKEHLEIFGAFERQGQPLIMSGIDSAAFLRGEIDAALAKAGISK